jgi:hypothetical protein
MLPPNANTQNIISYKVSNKIELLKPPAKGGGQCNRTSLITVRMSQ